LQVENWEKKGSVVLIGLAGFEFWEKLSKGERSRVRTVKAFWWANRPSYHPRAEKGKGGRRILRKRDCTEQL